MLPYIELREKVALMLLGQLSGFGTISLPSALFFPNTVQQIFPEQKREVLRPKFAFPTEKQHANQNYSDFSILPL